MTTHDLPHNTPTPLTNDPSGPTVEHRDTHLRAITEADGTVTLVIDRQETAIVDPATGARDFRTIHHLVPLTDGRLIKDATDLVRCHSCHGLTTTDQTITCDLSGKKTCRPCTQQLPDGRNACRACLTDPLFKRVLAWLLPE